MVKKIFLFLLPPILAVAVFLGVVFYVNKDPGKGALQVTASPKSAVFLDGRLIGETPLCKCEGQDMLQSGSYTVRLVPKEGNLPPYEEHISIGSSVLTVVDRIFGDGGLSEGKVITLTKIVDANTAELEVRSFPEDIVVLVDDAEIGKTPVKMTTLTASDHELKLQKVGYREKVIRIKLVTGYRLTLIATLGVSLNLNSTSATGSAQSVASAAASTSALPVVMKVVILDTPTGFLRVRDSGSLSGKEIAQVKPGETYDLVEEKEGWFSVKLNDGKVGWISSSYAKKE